MNKVQKLLKNFQHNSNNTQLQEISDELFKIKYDIEKLLESYGLEQDKIKILMKMIELDYKGAIIKKCSDESLRLIENATHFISKMRF